MRVFELAKQLGVPSKDLMNDLKTLGVTVSNHMAALEDEVVTQIMNKSASQAKKDGSKDSATPVVKKKAAVSRPPVSKTVSAAAELPKAEKKLILVKRRQAESMVGGDLLPLKPEDELSLEEAAERLKSPLAPVEPVADVTPPSTERRTWKPYPALAWGNSGYSVLPTACSRVV